MYISFSRFNQLVETTNNIVDMVEKNEEGNLYDFFCIMEDATNLTAEEITCTSGIANIVLPLAMRLMKRRAPDTLKEALTDDDFLKWVKEKEPLFKKKYGDEYKNILYQVALSKWNKTDVSKKYGYVDPLVKSLGPSAFANNKKIWEK